MMLGLPEDTKVSKFRDRLCAANGWVAGTLRHNDIRAFGHTEVFYALGPKDTDGTARVSDRELADLRLGLADNWEEVRRGYAALIEKPKGTRARWFCSEPMRQTMQLGLAVAEALGEEDTSTDVDFFYYVRSLLRRGQIAEPEDRPLRRQGDSSDAGPRKKTKSSGVIIHDDEPAIVRDVPPPTFPRGLPVPPPAPTPTPNVVSPSPAPPLPGPVVVCAADSVRLDESHANRLRNLTTRLAVRLYGGYMTPTQEQLLVLFPNADAYNKAMKAEMESAANVELVDWHYRVLDCARAPAHHTYFTIKIQIEMDMYRYSPNPKRPWAFSASLWTKFLRKSGCPKHIWEVTSSDLSTSCTDDSYFSVPALTGPRKAEVCERLQLIPQPYRG